MGSSKRMMLHPLPDEDRSLLKELEKVKYSIPPITRLHHYIEDMKTCDHHCVEYRIGGSGLKDLIYVLELNTVDVEEALYRKELNSNGVQE